VCGSIFLFCLFEDTIKQQEHNLKKEIYLIIKVAPIYHHLCSFASYNLLIYKTMDYYYITNPFNNHAQAIIK